MWHRHRWKITNVSITGEYSKRHCDPDDPYSPGKPDVVSEGLLAVCGSDYCFAKAILLPSGQIVELVSEKVP